MILRQRFFCDMDPLQNPPPQSVTFVTLFFEGFPKKLATIAREAYIYYLRKM